MKKTNAVPSVDERLTVALELIAAKFAELVELYKREVETFASVQEPTEAPPDYSTIAVNRPGPPPEALGESTPT